MDQLKGPDAEHRGIDNRHPRDAPMLRNFLDLGVDDIAMLLHTPNQSDRLLRQSCPVERGVGVLFELVQNLERDLSRLSHTRVM